MFVGGACGSIHVESFNRNMKALGVLESKWDPIRKKLARHLLEEQDKVLRSCFAQKGRTWSRGGDRGNCRGREHVQGTCMCEDGARRSWPSGHQVCSWQRRQGVCSWQRRHWRRPTLLEPSPYSTRIALRSAFLRERTEFMVDWPHVSWQPACAA